MASGEKVEIVSDFTFLGSKINADCGCSSVQFSCSVVSDSLWPQILWQQSQNLKITGPGKNSSDKPRQCIKKQRYHFADKGPYSQSNGFSNSHVWMWELDHKELDHKDHKELMLSNCGAGKDSWESFGQQEDQISQS